MSVLRKVPWSVTEEALQVLRRTAADFASLPPSNQPRWSSTRTTVRWARFDSKQVRAQSQYLRMVSVAEAYVDSVSEELFDRQVSALDSFFRTLVNETHSRSILTWEGRKTCFELHHGFKLEDCAHWPDFDRAIAVRNSIAHGLGTITKQQIQSKGERKVGLAKVRIESGRISVTADSLNLCLRTCLGFIESVDDKLPRP